MLEVRRVAGSISSLVNFTQQVELVGDTLEDPAFENKKVLCNLLGMIQ